MCVGSKPKIKTPPPPPPPPPQAQAPEEAKYIAGSDFDIVTKKRALRRALVTKLSSQQSQPMGKVGSFGV